MNSFYLKEKIDEVFTDFSEDTKKHLYNAFIYLSDINNNSDFISSLFELLCSIKKEHPEFIIESSSGRASQFDCDKEVLSLGRKNYLILMHEIGHVLHYYFNKYRVDDEFNNIQKDLSANQEVINKRDILLKQLDEEISRISTSAYDTEISDEEYERMLLEQKAYLEAKDFLDAFFKGTTESGHGLYYYSKDNDNAKAFSEMFATYISIKSFNQERIISALKDCLGDYTINMFEQLYQKINEHYLNNKIVSK